MNPSWCAQLGILMNPLPGNCIPKPTLWWRCSPIGLLGGSISFYFSNSGMDWRVCHLLKSIGLISDKLMDHRSTKTLASSRGFFIFGFAWPEQNDNWPGCCRFENKGKIMIAFLDWNRLEQLNREHCLHESGKQVKKQLIASIFPLIFLAFSTLG